MTLLLGAAAVMLGIVVKHRIKKVHTVSNMRITICHKIFFTLFCITMTVFSFSDVYAQSSWKHLSLKGLVDFIIQGVAGVLIPLAVTVLIFVFIYGIAVYMRAAGQGDGKMADLAKTRLLYGIVVLFAVFSLWGFVQILRNLFGGNEVFVRQVFLMSRVLMKLCRSLMLCAVKLSLMSFLRCMVWILSVFGKGLVLDVFHLRSVTFQVREVVLRLGVMIMVQVRHT